MEQKCEGLLKRTHLKSNIYRFSGFWLKQVKRFIITCNDEFCKDILKQTYLKTVFKVLNESQKYFKNNISI